MFYQSFDLISPLPREECLRRLRANIESDWLARYRSDKLVFGEVRVTTVEIGKIAYRNPFRPDLTADLIAELGRTRLRCRLRMNSIGVVLLAGWICLSVAVVFGVVASLSMGHSWVDVSTRYAWSAFIVITTCLGVISGWNERKFASDFLHETLGTQEVSQEH